MNYEITNYDNFGNPTITIRPTQGITRSIILDASATPELLQYSANQLYEEHNGNGKCFVVSNTPDDPTLRDLATFKLIDKQYLNTEGDLARVEYYKRFDDDVTKSYSGLAVVRKTLYIRRKIDGVLTIVKRPQVLQYLLNDGSIGYEIRSIKHYNDYTKVVKEGITKREHIINVVKGELLKLRNGNILSNLKPEIEMYVVDNNTEPLQNSISRLPNGQVSPELKSWILSKLGYTLTEFNDNTYSDEAFLNGTYSW